MMLVLVCSIVVQTPSLLARAGDAWPEGGSPISEGHQVPFRFLGNSANDDDRDGHYSLLQGVANGPAHWYFSRYRAEDRPYLYRVAYAEHLAHRFSFVKRVPVIDDPSTDQDDPVANCYHPGDLEYHVQEGTPWLVVPFECHDGIARMAFFKPDIFSQQSDSEYAYPHSFAVLSAWQRALPAVAVRRDGVLYTSDGGKVDTDTILEYRIPWDRVAAGGDITRHLSAPRVIRLVHSDGRTRFNPPTYRQGFDFSDDESLFFLSNGTGRTKESEHARRFLL
jgi:hypothetical protein